VHFSVQSNHLHLLVEADDRRALARGVQGLCVRVARAVNRQLERKGRLFADRYHARILKTARAAHFALRYVLLNARKHSARGAGAAVPIGFIDECSSAAWFDGFARPAALAFGARRVRAEWAAASRLASPVVRPQSWLLRVGYRSLDFDVDDVPGA